MALGIKSKLQLSFIESSIRFVPTDHLYTIQSMCIEGGLDDKENKRIYEMVSKQIRDRESGKLYKVLRGVKEVWIERKV